MNDFIRQPILIVDDEPQVLVALDDLLSDRFIVRVAHSAEQALRIVDEEREIAVVVTDQRMPGMAGDRLLAEIGKSTSAPGILVTGYADLTAVVRAVNEGQLFAYVTKPWDASDLLQKVGRAAEQYRLTKELAAERKLLVELINSSPDGICVKDLSLRYIRFNEAYASMLGRAPDDLTGRRLSELVPMVGDAFETEWAEREILDLGTPLIDQVKPAHLATGFRWHSIAKAPLRDVDGKVSGLVEIRRDVTDRVATSEALMESEEKSREKSRLLHSILDGMNEGVVVATTQGEFLLVNPSASRLLGAEAWDLRLDEWTERCGVLDAHRRSPLVGTEDPLVLATLGEEPDEIEVLLSNGARRELRVAFKATPLRDGKRVLGGIGVLRDVTEQRNLEQQLLQSQKMDAVGQLAGGVAHDFNNALAVMSIYAGLVMRKLDPADATLKDMGELVRAIERASSLTRQLLAFGRVQPIQVTVVALNDVVANMEQMLRRLIGERVRLITTAQSGLPHVRADLRQLEQVIMNLTINARDAMPNGGSLSIRTSFSPGSTPEDDGSVVLTVSDTGVGMPEAVLARVFEPFFTTKPVGKGTGLGLSTVHGIVKQNGGRIEVSSEPGRGTTFRVHFVPWSGEVASERVSQPPVSAPGGQTILLVEDDDAVRLAAVRILGEHGYLVVQASSAAEASRLLSVHGPKIDLLLTDMVLGEGSGAQVAAEVERHAPRARHLFMSGYMDADMSAERTFQMGPLLPKPFTPGELVRAVREVLSLDA